jgi:hypothetical protein
VKGTNFVKQMTEDEKVRPLTVSIPKYMYDWMKENFYRGQASQIMKDAVEELMNKSNKGTK